MLPTARPVVLAPRTALGSHFCVALSSAGANRILEPPRVSSNISSLRATKLTLLTGSFELSVSLGENRVFVSSQLIQWRDVTDRTVKSAGVVMLDVIRDFATRLFQRLDRLRTDTFGFQAPVPPLELAVGLGVIRTSSHVSQAAHAHKCLEVPGNELRAIVGNDPRRLAGILFQRTLDNSLGIYSASI